MSSTRSASSAQPSADIPLPRPPGGSQNAIPCFAGSKGEPRPLHDVRLVEGHEHRDGEEQPHDHDHRQGQPLSHGQVEGEQAEEVVGAEIQQRLGRRNVVLNSFILSWTRRSDLMWGWTPGEYAERHVLFMYEDQTKYVEQLVTTVLKDETAS